jgi:PAS domain S-box-containing protein
MSKPRKIGIDILGDIPWGLHFCNFYETKQDLLDMLVPYFKAGLENKEFCIWVVSDNELITVEEAKRALEHAVPDLDLRLAEGDIEIINGLEWYLEGNKFNIERVARAWDIKLRQATAQGYEGMRVSGDTFWLGQKYWKDFYAYENRLNNIITDLPMIVLCTYSLTKCNATEILDVVKAHKFAITRRQGEWEVIEDSEIIQGKSEIKTLHEELHQAEKRKPKPAGILKYVVAVMWIIAALVIAKIMDIHLVTAPVSLFLCALMLSTWYGGAKSGLLAMVLSVLALKFYFVTPLHSFAMDIHEVPRLIIFTLSAIFVVLLSVAYRNAKESFKNVREVLDVTVGKVWRINTALRKEIAERRHAETLLNAKEQEFRAIVENTPDQISRYDREFSRIYVNPAAASDRSPLAEILTGGPVDSANGDVGREVKEAEIVQTRQRIASVFATGKSDEYEISLPSPAGRNYHNVRLFPELDLNGSVINVLLIARNITERRRAEDELRLAYQRLSYLVENTPLAVMEFDNGLNIKRWSRRAEEIFGWEASEALGKNVYDPDFRIVFEEDLPAVDKINEQLLKGIVNRNLSLNRNYTRDGKLIYCEWYNSVLRDELGNVITILSLVDNVTERKQAEETLTNSYEEIRRLTNHLQNIREEERTYIAREIHDELGQQLTVLKMDIKALNKKLNNADEPIKQKIMDIMNLLDATVKSVRRISSELRPGLLHNLGLVAAIEWHLKEFEKKSGIKTIFNQQKDELELPDPIKNGLFRIFQESLTNVGKHASANNIYVTLEQKEQELILSIEDDGQGFEKEIVASKQTLGVLGMKERSQMMNGNFEIRSIPGKGAIVMVTVPYIDKG